MVELLQTVETLIRRRVLRRLIWVCTVCQIPSPDYNGLSEMDILSKLFCLPAKKGALLEIPPSLTTERDRERYRDRERQKKAERETEKGRQREREKGR